MGNFHLMAKPVGPACNLSCSYCFYLEKQDLFEQKSHLMNDQVLETYIEKYIKSQKSSHVEFTWQGGEPTLAGLDFYKKVIELQQVYGKGKEINNSLQTNGTLINDKWCRFLAKHHFLVGLSLDGPLETHNIYRKDQGGHNTFHLVENAISLLKKYKIDFNILTTVNRVNSQKPLEVYGYYKKRGIQYIQFIPIVERIKVEDLESNELDKSYLNLASPDMNHDSCKVTSWSVEPDLYAVFLITLFDEWIRNDIGNIFVMNFEQALASAIHGISGTCHFAEKCGTAGVIEHNGDVYACDHFVYPAYKIGNVLEDDLAEIFNSKKQLAFGEEKLKGLSNQCINCEVLRLCNGGCPKHRFDNGQNYLCKAYKKFFNHIIPYAKVARKLIHQGRPLTELMTLDMNHQVYLPTV